MNYRGSPDSISHHKRRYRQVGPVNCLCGRRENAGMPPQEKGRRMWDMRRPMALIKGTSVTKDLLEITGSELGWQSCRAEGVRRALGRPSPTPSYRWSDDG